MKPNKNEESVYDKLLKKREELKTSGDNHKLVERDLAIIDKLLSDPSRAEHIAASKKYLISKNFSRNPTAMCSLCELGMPGSCKDGEGKYCYYKKACELQTKLDGSGKPASDAAARKLAETTNDAYDESSSKYDTAELSRYADEIAYSLVLMEGKKILGEEI